MVFTRFGGFLHYRNSIIYSFRHVCLTCARIDIALNILSVGFILVFTGFGGFCTIEIFGFHIFLDQSKNDAHMSLLPAKVVLGHR